MWTVGLTAAIKRRFKILRDSLHLALSTVRVNNKHSMIGPKENSEFCFPRISMFVEGNIEIRGEQNKANFEKRGEIPVTTSGHL